MMNIKYNFCKIIVLFIALLTISTNVIGQTAQTINPDGGASANLDDGLKVVVNPRGILSVYRQDQTQYYNGYTWPAGTGSGVALSFRFDNGTTNHTSNLTMTACSTTPAQQNGNDWTTSISGYVISPISSKKFFVTMNFHYTHPNRHFLVDYYVRAPFDLVTPETVHLYLDHDAYILGSDASFGYMTTNATGQFVGDYRTSVVGSCNMRVKNPRYPSTHGFKTKGGFRSYHSASFSGRGTINNSTLMLSNMISTTCQDDGVVVEFTIGPLSAGQIGTKQVLHGYGNEKGEFDNTVVNDPIPPTGLLSPVTVNFTSAAFSEAEGDNSHLANNIQIEVSSGKLAQDQICNFSVVSGGNAVQNTDYTYVKGFIIPAGDYSTPRTFTLNNFTILGNTNCQNDRTIKIGIDSEVCNDLVQLGITRQTTYTIVDDDKPEVNQPGNTKICKGTTVPIIVFSGSTLPNTTYTWTNNNTAIGLAASGTGDIAAFTATNTTANPITATITVTPKQGSCSGDPKQFTITVNPTATVNVITDITACNGAIIPLTSISSATTGATFAWTNSNPAIGLAASGTGNIPAFTATNTTANPIVSTIRITPTYNGCVGTPREFTITVNPTATVNSITDITVCNGATIPLTSISSLTAGATFAWTNSNPAIGLAVSGTGNIPSFVATNTTANPISATIRITPTYNGCIGTPRQFTIKVYATTTTGTINGNPFVCIGVRPLAIKGQASTGGSGSFTYQWQQSPNNSTWTTITGATGLDYTPSVLTSNTYFRRNTIDASCGTFPSDPFLIVVAPPTSLYWKTNAADNNWNNPANWVDVNGVQLNMVPLGCSDVHIYGGSSRYPSLATTSTIEGVYGKATCQNIYFHFGSEVAYPQNLTYEKAYIQYNWGYYNKTSGITANNQPTANVDGATAPQMQRGKWYALAAPLKNMASGDFALAGYPLTWQSVYNMTNPITGLLEIDFSKPFATNDVNLSKTNNTIVVKVAPYNIGIGYNNQRHLESLKGVIEIPYFENTTQVPFRPGHQYDPLSKKNTFFYFDTKTLKQIYSPVGQMKRGIESYRFIFEKDDNKIGTINVNGATIKGYSQSVSVLGSSRNVMIGNPFMASINAKNFYDANATKLVGVEGYKIFSSTTQTWTQFLFTAANNIGPLQAFVVTLASGLNSADLLFPLEGDLALTGAQFKGSVQRSVVGSSLFVRSVDSKNKYTDYAVLSNEDDQDIKKVVSKDGHAVPEAFFISPANDYNLVQAYNDKSEDVRLGVKTSNTKDVITLEFGNVTDFASIEGVHPILEDQLLNIKHDLLKKAAYTFNQQKLDSTSFYADVNRFVLRLPKSTTGIEDDKDADKSVIITYERNELSVHSDYYLSQVLVFDLEGRQVHNSGDLGASSLAYVKYLSLPHGSYIVKMMTIDGKIVTKKIITQQ